MTHSPPPLASPHTDASTADLVRLASTQISALIRDEVALGRMEMMAKARNAGMGAGMIGAAGVLAAYGLGALPVLVGLLLALVLPGWAAAAIVTGALFLIAAVLALLGRSRLKRATPPMPKDAIAGLRADVNEMSVALHRGPQRANADRAAFSRAAFSRAAFNGGPRDGYEGDRRDEGNRRDDGGRFNEGRRGHGRDWAQFDNGGRR